MHLLWRVCVCVRVCDQEIVCKKEKTRMCGTERERERMCMCARESVCVCAYSLNCYLISTCHIVPTHVFVCCTVVKKKKIRKEGRERETDLESSW